MKLYYTIENETDDWEGITLTGNKEVSVYEIKNNEPVDVLSFQLELDDNTKEEILDKLYEVDYFKQIKDGENPTLENEKFYGNIKLVRL